MIELNDNLLIGNGSERSCYLHPDDRNICIKIVRTPNKRAKARTNRELKYAIKYKRAKIPLDVIPTYLGEVETNLGDGHQFSVVRDFDGNISSPLVTYISNNVFDSVILQKIILTYYAFLQSKALVSDLHPSNILLQKIDDYDFKLMIIDGFGNSDFIKICDYVPLFFRRKLIRKFKRMLINLNLPTEEIR